MSEKLNAALDQAAEDVLRMAKIKAGETWADIPEEGKAATLLAARRLTELGILEVAGHDVEADRKLVLSTIADWAWVGASIVEGAIKAAVEEFVKIAGKALVAALAGML